MLKMLLDGRYWRGRGGPHRPEDGDEEAPHHDRRHARTRTTRITDRITFDSAEWRDRVNRGGAEEQDGAPFPTVGFVTPMRKLPSGEHDGVPGAAAVVAGAAPGDIPQEAGPSPYLPPQLARAPTFSPTAVDTERGVGSATVEGPTRPGR